MSDDLVGSIDAYNQGYDKGYEDGRKSGYISGIAVLLDKFSVIAIELKDEIKNEF